MKTKSLELIRWPEFNRIGLCSTETALELNIGNICDIYRDFPPAGLGPAAVDAKLLSDSDDQLSREVNAHGEIFVIVSDGLSGLPLVIRKLSESYEIDGALKAGSGLVVRITFAGEKPVNDNLVEQILQLGQTQGSEESVEDSHTRVETAKWRANLYEAGIRILKPYKDYFPAPLLVAMYKCAHLIKGQNS